MITVKSLASGILAAGPATIYAPPALTSAIVMDISLVLIGVTPSTAPILYKPSGGTARLIVPQALELHEGDHYQRRGRITMAAGDELIGSASGANVEYVISGIERA